MKNNTTEVKIFDGIYHLINATIGTESEFETAIDAIKKVKSRDYLYQYIYEDDGLPRLVVNRRIELMFKNGFVVKDSSGKEVEVSDKLRAETTSWLAEIERKAIVTGGCALIPVRESDNKSTILYNPRKVDDKKRKKSKLLNVLLIDHDHFKVSKVESNIANVKVGKPVALNVSFDHNISIAKESLPSSFEIDADIYMEGFPVLDRTKNQHNIVGVSIYDCALGIIARMAAAEAQMLSIVGDVTRKGIEIDNLAALKAAHGEDAVLSSIREGFQSESSTEPIIMKPGEKVISFPNQLSGVIDLINFLTDLFCAKLEFPKPLLMPDDQVALFSNGKPSFDQFYASLDLRLSRYEVIGDLILEKMGFDPNKYSLKFKTSSPSNDKEVATIRLVNAQATLMESQAAAGVGNNPQTHVQSRNITNINNPVNDGTNKYGDYSKVADSDDDLWVAFEIDADNPLFEEMQKLFVGEEITKEPHITLFHGKILDELSLKTLTMNLARELRYYHALVFNQLKKSVLNGKNEEAAFVLEDKNTWSVTRDFNQLISTWLNGVTESSVFSLPSNYVPHMTLFYSDKPESLLAFYNMKVEAMLFKVKAIVIRNGTEKVRLEVRNGDY